MAVQVAAEILLRQDRTINIMAMLKRPEITAGPWAVSPKGTTPCASGCGQSTSSSASRPLPGARRRNYGLKQSRLSNLPRNFLPQPSRYNVRHMARVVYFTASDATRLILRGEVTPSALRAAIQRGDLQVAARTAGGIALFSREAIEAYAARRDARRHAREVHP